MDSPSAQLYLTKISDPDPEPPTTSMSLFLNDLIKLVVVGPVDMLITCNDPRYFIGTYPLRDVDGLGITLVLR